MKDRISEALETEALHIELSSYCNVDCEPCIHRYMDRAKGYMSMDTAYEIFQQLTTDPFKLYLPFLKHLTFNGFGESLLNPKALGILRMFRGVHPWQALNSNATVYLDGLTTSGIQELVLNINEYDGPRFDNAVKYIHNLGELKHLVLQLLISPNTQDKVERFVENFKPYLFISDKIQIYLKYPTHSVLYGTPFENLRDDLLRFQDKQIIVGGNNYMIGAETCHGTNGILVLNDGTMSLGCCQVGLLFKIGHISDGIFNILSGASGNFYELKGNIREFEPCKECIRLTNEYKARRLRR